ncbi:16S rRNA (adenine1518-N6/adenine1519-N6)-dimethyltransferase [Cupriavidus metallidurans]|jgi:16S rRNA (adenine1518-N6/adenine1519-N6)-dimethyltransferase|uniref:Ribosomal RNA small subunit methyltransferase A n=1 Tax=Cupriavidus metallidurans (strain ATCC 43123 / DSM 2839 / NBRC 102507 / CH34) TaxID=266264 RepID=RSMA_CUPMC|nr:16S rRNA (adenine(1518)-N(6)/adenine(1519)-N(6))-dimethyltransferase RsmA [Cupriavidus metallidurans]Q1LRA1.1 RecName: Full=Ribosomal RNA small subunit methyltransferase A; AltName: Full=16S rRNA (adenine(1518)-N(6)/adenine(1519)-N(6))-dimethyltransferase; AltName: Full=16S rRNA dimethyladenosine transferase; AltName: Full=16S rRNA dimethylase; AltName: Full=S-adenosylmethionine-6-N', N'-adenosyl(rRNA) dimethyltransferase [Cupriavidus metallidurans CH34]ABF07325.1 S-adenosylmethionine-6-N',N'-
MRSNVHQGHVARKRFGQNFLVDDGIIHGIVSAIDPQPNDIVVEIGPGLGALTDPLLERLPGMQVVELDRDLVERLRRRYGDRLVVHAGDALAFDFGKLREPGRALRIVGNLPYNISSPLLFHLVDFADDVRDQHFMLQKEVVERMVADPGSKSYGRLSIMLQVRYHMEHVLDVPPASFNPPPKVDSAVVRMIPWPRAEDGTLRSPYAACDAGVLGDVVTAAFSQRRKVLRNTLSFLRDQVDFDALGFDLTRRAEEVPVAEYVELARIVGGAEPPARVA